MVEFPALGLICLFEEFWPMFAKRVQATAGTIVHDWGTGRNQPRHQGSTIGSGQDGAVQLCSLDTGLLLISASGRSVDDGTKTGLWT